MVFISHFPVDRRTLRKELHCLNLQQYHFFIHAGASQGMGSQGAATASGINQQGAYELAKHIDLDVTSLCTTLLSSYVHNMHL